MNKSEIINNLNTVKKFVNRLETYDSQVTAINNKQEENRNKLAKKIRIYAIISIFVLFIINVLINAFFTYIDTLSGLNFDFPMTIAFIIYRILSFWLIYTVVKPSHLVYKMPRSSINSDNDKKEAEIKNEKALYFKSKSPRMQEIIGSAYWNMYALNYILQNIQNGRADTLKEAITLYELDERERRDELRTRQIIASNSATRVNSDLAIQAANKTSKEVASANYQIDQLNRRLRN